MPSHLLWSRRDLRQHRRCEISQHAGIVGFNAHFIGLSGDDVDELVVPDGTGGQASLYRDATQPQDPHGILPSCLPLKQGSVNITSAKWRYNDFRTKEYDPNSQVVPWTVKLPGAVDR
jgi:hypothetical protein